MCSNTLDSASVLWLYTVIHWGMIGDLYALIFPLVSCVHRTLPTHTDLQIRPGCLHHCIRLPGGRSHPWLSWGFCVSTPTQGMNLGASVWGVSYFGHQFSFRQGVTYSATWKHSSQACNLIKSLLNIKRAQVLHSFISVGMSVCQESWYTTFDVSWGVVHLSAFAGVHLRRW
jgi:hypothetical protein